jgi:hypothetical protein
LSSMMSLLRLGLSALLASNAPLKNWEAATFYSAGAKGYTVYTPLDVAQ